MSALDRFVEYLHANPGATVLQMSTDLGYGSNWCYRQMRALRIAGRAHVSHWSKSHVQYLAHWIAEPGQDAPKPVVSRSTPGARHALLKWLIMYPRSSVVEAAKALGVTLNYAAIALRRLHVLGQARIVAWKRGKRQCFALWSAEAGQHALPPEPIGRSNVPSTECVARIRAALAGGELPTAELAAELGVSLRVAGRMARQCAHFVVIRYERRGAGGTWGFFRLADAHECRPAPTIEEVATPRRRIVPAGAPIPDDVPMRPAAQSWLSALGIVA
jgi:hypothetical protein